MRVRERLRLGVLMLAMAGFLSTCAAGKSTPTVSSKPAITIVPTVTLATSPELEPSPDVTPILTESEKECIALESSWDSPALGEVIERLGEPDAVELLEGFLTWPLQGEIPCDCATVRPEPVDVAQDWPKIPGTDNLNETWQPYYLQLDYPQRGMLILSSRLPEEYPCLCPQMEMESLICRRGGTFRIADIHKRDPIANEHIYPWPGFGRVDLSELEPLEIDGND